MVDLSIADQYIRMRITEGDTYQSISSSLQHMYPMMSRGLSGRSVRRYCSRNQIRRHNLITDQELDRIVESSVFLLGPSYGRRTMNGYLRSQGYSIAEHRLRRSMRRVTPLYVEHRDRNTYRQLNPRPYFAEYYGHKLHMDQNEKLIRYGVTHVAASDGYSGKILGIVSMSIKNPILIYDQLFRPILESFGIWDQVRVDCGREFALILFVQDLLADHRTNPNRSPYSQTQSTQNHTAERHWVEVNNRVNYPLKRALVMMEESQLIDMECMTTKFCISFFTKAVAQFGIQQHIQSWNHHTIPGKGIPDQLSSTNNRVGYVNPSLLPNTATAVSLFRNADGHLSAPLEFGADPLRGHAELLEERQRLMDSNLPPMDFIFGSVVNNSYQVFADCLKYMLDVTNFLTQYS